MNKCTNCGHEFEGNFCPNCGAKYEGEHIGAMEADVSQPVQPVQPAQPAAQHTQAPKIVKKLYAHMPKLISVLFAVFAVLMLICFAGGVQKSDLGEEFGGTPESVYSYISSSDASAEEELEEEFSAFAAADDEDSFGEDSDATLKNVCAALVAFGVIAVVFAAFGLAVAFWVPLSAVKFHIGDRTLKLSHIVNIISYTLVFVIFLLGCILCANAGDELGLAEPGAAPICIIFFSLLFGLLMVAALFGRKIISYIWGGVKQEYEDELKERRVGLVAPVAPDVVAKPQKPKKPKKPDYKEAAVADSEEEKKKIVKHIKRRETVAYLAMILATLFVGSIVAIVHFAKTKAQDFWKVCKRGSIRVANIFSPILMFGSLVALVILIVIGTSPILYMFTMDLRTFEEKSDGFENYAGDKSYISMSEFEKGECNIIPLLEACDEHPVYHLGDAAMRKISKMSDEEFLEYLLHRQNLWNFSSTYYWALKSECYYLDGLLYIASADGLDNVVQGYEKNAKPVIDAINALNEYFEFDLTGENFNSRDDAGHLNFNILYCGVVDGLDIFENDNGVTITLRGTYGDGWGSDSYNYSQIITEEQYTELQGKLQAIPNVWAQIASYDSNKSYYDFYNANNSIMMTLGTVIWSLSYYDPELTTRNAIINMYDEMEFSIYGDEDPRDSIREDANWDLLWFMLCTVLPCVGVIYFLVLWIFAIIMLITSNKYTKQVLNDYYSKYNYSGKKQQYEEQLKEYKAYRKAYFGYLVELGYFEEGVPHVAKKQKA